MGVNISANDGIILPFVSISTFTKQIDSTLRLCFQSTLSYNAHFIQTNLIQLFWCDLSMTVNVMVLLIVNFILQSNPLNTLKALLLRHLFYVLICFKKKINEKFSLPNSFP
jgi:hypothetical protein